MGPMDGRVRSADGPGDPGRGGGRKRRRSTKTGLATRPFAAPDDEGRAGHDGEKNVRGRNNDSEIFRRRIRGEEANAVGSPARAGRTKKKQ